MEWSKLRDLHTEALTPFGKVWIRLDREGVATGIYPPVGGKLVPHEGCTLSEAKVLAECLIDGLAVSTKPSNRGMV